VVTDRETDTQTNAGKTYSLTFAGIKMTDRCDIEDTLMQTQLYDLLV